MDMDMGSTATACNMSMLWNWYTIDTCFVAESWHVSSNGAFAATCIGTVLLVMAMEALRRLGKEYDEWVLRGFRARAAGLDAPSPSDPLLGRNYINNNNNNNNNPPNNPGSPKAAGGYQDDLRTVVFRASPLQQAVRAVLHAVSLGVAYVVMLLVMSYNGYVIICVIIGGGLGKFFCDWMTRRMVVRVAREAGGEEGGAAGLEEPSMCCG